MRTHVPVVLLLGAALGASALVAGPAAAATSAPLRLRNKAQNLCLELPRTGDAGGVVGCTDGSASDNLFIHTPAGELKSLPTGRCLHTSGLLQTCNGAAAQRWKYVHRGGGWFGFESLGAPGQCLVSAGGPRSLKLAACATDEGQQWSWESTGMALLNTTYVKRSIVAAHNNMCLGVQGGSKEKGAAIVATPCSEWAARIVLDNLGGQNADGHPNFAIRSRATGMCFDVPKASTVDNVGLQQWDCNRSAAQTFHLIDDPAGGVALVTKSGKCLEFDAGGRLVQRTCKPPAFAARQRHLVDGPRPARIRNRANDLCLDPPMWHGDDSSVSVAPCDAGRDQQFSYNEDGELVSLARAKCLDVGGTSAAKGQGIFLWDCEDRDDQRWKSITQDAPFELRNKMSDLCADLPGYHGKSGDPMTLQGCDAVLDQRWTWDRGATIGPIAPKMTLAYTATGGGKGKVCAPGNTLCIRGTFTGDPQTGVFTTSGTLVVDTPLGPWQLGDTALDVDLKQPRIAGTAKVAVPNLGFLTGSGTQFEADVVIGRGGGSAELSGGTFTLDPARFYVYARAKSAANFKLPGGGGDLTIDLVDNSVLLVEPASPTVYLEGAAISMGPLASVLPGVDAIGFSLGECFPYTLDNEVLDHLGNLQKRSVCGNILLAGKFNFRKIFYGQGTIVVDIDGDDDGTNVFAGEPRDFRLALDGTGGIEKSIVDLPLGSASLYLDGAAGSFGRAELAATCGKPNFFAGTPLEPVKIGAAVTRVLASFDDDQQKFRFHVTSPTLIGWQLANLTADLTWSGNAFVAATITSLLDLGLADVQVAGDFQGASSWSVTGTGSLDFAGAKFADAKLTLGPSGTRFKGTGGYAGLAGFKFDGAISAAPFEITTSIKAGGSGKFGLLTGKAEGDARLTITRTSAGAKFDGTISVVGFDLFDRSLNIDGDSGKICTSLSGIGSGCVDLSP